MTFSMEKLQTALKTNNVAQIREHVKHLLSRANDYHLQESDRDVVQSLLKFENNEVGRLSVEMIAELAKIEDNRKILTENTIIQLLLKIIKHYKDTTSVNNAFRSLGNICYENNEGRNLIGKTGLEDAICVLNLEKNEDSKSIDLNGSGFILNLITSSQDLQKAALKLNILDTISKLFSRYMNGFSSNEPLFYFLLTILNTVIDYLEDQNVSFPTKLCSQVVQIFKVSTNKPEISVVCLEILHNQSEKDEIKTVLAKEGTCELVIQLIEKYKNQVNDEESRSVLKMACDMIVIVLTGDDCMNLLYHNGNGEVYKNMLKWLDSDDSDLLSTGVLALGNFARKDTHCIQMVKNGVSKKLIEILSKHNTPQGDIKVQHALLSTLKNLVIPQQNKSQVLQEGLIDVIYPLIKIDQHMVVFKLLGTFRMVIDSQEKAALELLSREDFIKRLVYWCYNSDHLGVRGEVPRLLAWLMKYCHSFKPFHTLLRVENAVKCIVEMISSNHAVMQNEAFYALNLLCIGCPLSTTVHETSNNVSPNENDTSDQEILYQQIVAADIGKHLNFILNKYSDKMEKHTLENLLSLLEQLVNSEVVVKHLKQLNVNETVSKLLNNPNTNDMKDRIEKVLAEITA